MDNINIKKLAKELNLSTSTVSRAFRGNTDINQETKARILALANELNYEPENLKYGNSSGAYNVKTLATALKRQEMAAAFFLSVPGPKMIWQFGELGYDISIDQNGRTGEKPIYWEYNNNSGRKSLYNVFSKMIKWKIKNPVYKTTNYTHSLTGAIKYIKLMSSDVNVMVIGNLMLLPKMLQ